MAFLLFFTFVGALASFKAKKTNKDYLLAGQDVKPWLVALSAVSTNNSGYMFIGQIGFSYTYGLHSIWLMIGWIIGDFIGSLLIHQKLRQMSERREVLSFGGIISNWQGKEQRWLRLVIGIITILFLGTYAGAQFKAGSKALHVLLGWDLDVGAYIGAVIVFIYCLAGGIRASIWTDAAQSLVMIFAMSVLLFFTLAEVGGVNLFIEKLHQVSPSYMSLFPDDAYREAFSGKVLFILGWVFAGLGVIGQPHIMVRFMALDNSKNMNRTRMYYYGWYIAFYIFAICVGLGARLLLPEVASFDAELALPQLSMALLPPILVGVMLAGIFAATMSTADSQILSCSAALTRDIIPKKWTTLIVTKLGTLGITLLALVIALYGGQSVFNLVLIAWSVLASAFGPLLILLVFNRRIPETLAILMIVVSTSVSLIWRSQGLSELMYEIAPGMLSGILLYFLAVPFFKKA